VSKFNVACGRFRDAVLEGHRLLHGVCLLREFRIGINRSHSPDNEQQPVF